MRQDYASFSELPIEELEVFEDILANPTPVREGTYEDLERMF